MTKMNWAKAKQRDLARRPDVPPKIIGAHPARPLPRFAPANATWPRTVTTGPAIDGCLQVFIFQSPQEAAAAGCRWIID